MDDLRRFCDENNVTIEYIIEIKTIITGEMVHVNAPSKLLMWDLQNPNNTIPSVRFFEKDVSITSELLDEMLMELRKMSQQK